MRDFTWLLKTSSLMSIDHMDGSVFGTGLLAKLLCLATLRSREYGISTSAERTAPLSVKRRNAFRFLSYRLRRCIHRDIAAPRNGAQCSNASKAVSIP
jgi:hypothetical protein